MTATQSPRELLTAYREDARSAAAEARTPGTRGHFPGLPLAATGMIYLAGKNLVYRGLASAPEPVDMDRLEAALTEEGSCIIVADTRTYFKLATLADETGEGFKTLSRRLSFSRSLSSVKLPILTTALAYRYWLPAGMDERNLDDWAKAFNVTGPSHLTTMRALIDLAHDGNRSKELNYEGTVKTLESSERRILDQAQWGGISSDVQLYGMMDGFNGNSTGLRLRDPGLLAMHSLDGQISQLRPMNATAENFSAAVSDPFKFKVGTKIRLTDGRSMVSSKLESLRYTEDALHAVFTRPRLHIGRDMVEQAKRIGGRPMYALPAPFTGGKPAILTKRWLNPKEPVQKTVRKNVPLDVILAGAPTE